MVVEGVSDAPFLRILITRQLEELLLAKAPGPVSVHACELADRRITGSGTAEEVAESAWKLAQDCHLVFVHSDEKERGTAEKLTALLRERARGTKSAEPVALVPVRMTESWMLADREAISRSVAGADLSGYPYKSPAAVEKAHNSPTHQAYAKNVWEAIAGKGHGGVLDDSMELLAQHIDLELLSQLPSYQRWRVDTEDALKTKGFL
nr:DUF4276 family protein [Streptomyces sp. CBMA156]